MRRVVFAGVVAALGLSGCGEKQPEVIIDPAPPSNSGPADLDMPIPQPPGATNTAAPTGPAAANPGAATPAAATSAASGAGPRRKPGLWRLTAVGETTTNATLCVTEASEATVNAFDTRMLTPRPGGGGQGGPRPEGAGAGGPRPGGGGGGGAQCPPRITKTAAGWQGSATCTREMGEASMQISVSETLSGDLQSKYTLKSRRTISGAPMPQMNRTIDLTVEGAYAGACPAGQTGGDLTIGGRTVNLASRG